MSFLMPQQPPPPLSLGVTRMVHRQLEHSSRSTNSETNIFLGINITIVVVLLICILGYCYFFRNRFDAIIRHQLELNDQALEQNIRERQAERERVLAAAQQRTHRNTTIAGNTDTDNHDIDYEDDNQESTDDRRALLVDSFLRNKVTMIVTEDDFSNEASERMIHAEEDDFYNEKNIITMTSTTTTTVPHGDENQNDGNNNENHNHVVNATNEISSSSNVVNHNLTIPPKNRIDSLEEGEVRYLWIGGGSDVNQNDVPSPSTSSTLRRRVPNCCAICLAPYEVHETVVWSCSHSPINNNNTSINSNNISSIKNGCNHAFHYDCMIDWLIKVRDGTPCPCCRREFTDLPILPRRHKLRTTTQQQQLDRLRNFDLGVFSFR